jgi:hypothetical protein
MRGKVSLFRLSGAYLTVRSITIRIFGVLPDAQAYMLQDLRHPFALVFYIQCWLTECHIQYIVFACYCFKNER